MKERPILFSSSMVQAILANQKSQTRRVIKNACDVVQDLDPNDPTYGPFYEDAYGEFHRTTHACPYGQTGDRLWVKETWQYYNWTEDGDPVIRYAADDYRRICDDIPEGWWDRLDEIWVSLSENRGQSERAADSRWRPSIFMPKWAARIWIEIVNVRVERVQDISDDDMYAEGTLIWADGQDLRHSDGTPAKYPSVRYAFRALWDIINAERGYGWDKNPWVWVLEFRRIEPCTTP